MAAKRGIRLRLLTIPLCPDKNRSEKRPSNTIFFILVGNLVSVIHINFFFFLVCWWRITGIDFCGFRSG